MNEKTGLKNEELIHELVVSGSGGVTTKNSAGVYVFTDKSDTDGVIYGKLVKPEYNINELVKSVDTNISELLPVTKSQGPAMVLKTIYDEAITQISVLNGNIKTLESNILKLNGKISELHTVTKSLSSYADNQSLLAAAAQNQSDQISVQISSHVTSLQNAIQKATYESIQRVSAEARNKVISDQLTVLKDTLSAKTQAIEAGGVSSGQLATILFSNGNPKEKGASGTNEIRANLVDSGYVAANGEHAEFYQKNFKLIAGTLHDIKVDISFEDESGNKWINPYVFDKSMYIQFPITMSKGDSKIFSMETASDEMKKLRGRWEKSKLYGLGSTIVPDTEYRYYMVITIRSVDTSEIVEQLKFGNIVWKYTYGDDRG